MKRMLKLFRLIEAENAYIRQNLEKFSKLGEREKAILHFKLKSYSFTSMAEIMNSTPDQIRSEYARTLKLLGIESNEEIERFARTFKII